MLVGLSDVVGWMLLAMISDGDGDRQRVVDF